jgi:hypothetical protein
VAICRCHHGEGEAIGGGRGPPVRVGGAVRNRKSERGWEWDSVRGGYGHCLDGRGKYLPQGK